jgi:hypothetical protein
MTKTPTPTIYQSRSRANRRRFLAVGAVVALVLIGFLIGRLRGGSDATATPPAALPSSLAVPSAEPSPSASSRAPGDNPWPIIQAESASQLNGVATEDTQDTGGGKNVGFVSRGDSIRFDDLDLGPPANSIYVRYASEANDEVGGRMRFRLDSPTNTPIGELPVTKTGGWQTWRTVAVSVSEVSGTHTLYVTFDADRGDDFVNLNWLRFNGP